MARVTVLLVDDDDGVRFGVRKFLELNGYDVEEAATCAAGEQTFRKATPDVVVLDYALPDGTALDLLPRLKAIDADVPIALLTAHASIDLAVSAVKMGAEQYLTKPIELPALLVVLERLVAQRRDRQKQMARNAAVARADIDVFAGTSIAIRRLADEAGKVVGSDWPILILGETGTGKGVLARWLHAHGTRDQEPFVDLNCAGFSRELVESELFGHERGAFTGAVAPKTGLLEMAHRGSLFLDEIGDLDAPVQSKLLTVLEEKRFRRVGGTAERRVDVRLISATHHPLAELVEQGRFRRDLYFRVSSLPLEVPALRRRVEDIPIVARNVLERLAAELGRSGTRLSSGAVAALQSYAWPGNVRELRNVLERAILLSDHEELEARDLRFEASHLTPAAGATDELTLDEVERRHIERVLAGEGGRVAPAAIRLGIARSSLYEKIKKYGLGTSEK